MSVLTDKRKHLLDPIKNKISSEAAEQCDELFQKMDRSRDQRNRPSKFFDGMGYLEDYFTNENNKNTYLTPKLNDSEVRVNTGTSEKKIDAIKNELLTMDFKHHIKAYDEFDLPLSELGDDMTDLITRTYQQERDPYHEDTESESTDDLLAQRGCFRQELFTTKTLRDGKTKQSYCQNRIVSGLKVFPGEVAMSPYRWNEQPYVVMYDRMSYTVASILYGHLPNFQLVRSDYLRKRENLGVQFNYRFGVLEDGEVEILTYEDLPNNIYQVTINGIPMFGVDNPLPQSYNMYSIQFFTNKAMSLDWLYGRPFTAMAKTMQALSNENIRLLIRKFQQALEPPLGVPNTGKIYAKNMWDPGRITQGIKKDDLSTLINHDSVTQGEFQMFKLIEDKTEEFIGTPNIAQGMNGSREMSATEVMTLTKQFIKQLGYTVAAKLRMSNVLAEQRLYNILDNYLDPIKKKVNNDGSIADVYRSFSISNATLENNLRGNKVIIMTGEDPTGEKLQQIHAYEEQQEKIGNNIRIKFLNTKKLTQFKKYWYIHSDVQDKEGTALDKVLFEDQLTQAANIIKLTGTPLNPQMPISEFERKWKAKDWFQKRSPVQIGPDGMPMQPGQGMDGQGSDVSGQAKELMSKLDMMQNGDSMGAQMNRGNRGSVRSAGRQAMAAEATT